MKKYIILNGRHEELTNKIIKHINEGWDLLGGITSTTQGSVVMYSQALTKEVVEELPERRPSGRKNTGNKKNI